MKERMNQIVDSIAQELIQMSDAIFDFDEKGYVEYKSSALLCQWLENHGYTVERGVGGLETAFRAVYQHGEGGPNIGLLAEYDAMPMGHSCGHHMQGPVMLGVAEALKESGLDMPFKLVIYGTPAEEGPGGKKIMLKNGCFRDIDFSLMMHSSSSTSVGLHSMAGRQYTFTYHGVEAHTLAAPEKSRSAMDSALIAFQGVEFMRGHVPSDCKFHYALKDCEGMPHNTNPEIAVGSITMMTHSEFDLPELCKRLVNLIKGAAMMNGCTVDIDITSRSTCLEGNFALADVIMKNAEYFDAPNRKTPVVDKTRGGGTDFAVVTRLAPGACLSTAFVPESVPSHSVAYMNAGKTESAHNAVVLSAKILAATCYDLLTVDGLLDSCVKEFRAKQDEYEKNWQAAMDAAGEVFI